MNPIAGSWWSLLVRGLIAIALGVAAFLLPAITLGALILVFGAYAVVEGVINIAGAWRRGHHHERWGALLFEGVVSVLAGVVAFLMPGITAFALVMLVAGWAIVTGIFELVAAVRLRKHIRGEWLLALCGVISILFGAYVFAFPIAGVLAITLWFGMYEILFGILLTTLGFKLRRLHRSALPPSLGHALPSR